jgi:hypothetical protein
VRSVKLVEHFENLLAMMSECENGEVKWYLPVNCKSLVKLSDSAVIVYVIEGRLGAM